MQNMEVQSCCSETFKNGNSIQPEDNIPVSLLNCVENIAKKEGFTSHNVEGKKVSTNGGNYLAELFTFDIKETTKNGDKEINLFVKHETPAGDNVNSFLSTSEVYAIENFVYKDLARIFKEVEDEFNIPAEERYKIVKGFDGTSSNFIIMENITKKGFKTCERKEIPPLSFSELSMQQLAKFHALGFILKKYRPIFFEQTLLKMKFPIKLNEQWSDFYNKVAKVSINNLKIEWQAKAKNFILSAPKKYIKYYNDTTSTQTLCHGDFRVLNIMMKEEEGKVTEIIPVDLQLVHYGCPVNDLMYFLAGCTDKQLRKSHFDYLLELYYDSLQQYLKYFNIDVADVYPRSDFDAAVKERADFGLIIAIGFFPFLLANEDDFPDLNDSEISSNVDPYVVNRIEEMIEDLDELGLL